MLMGVLLALPFVWLVPTEASRGCQALSLKVEIVNHPMGGKNQPSPPSARAAAAFQTPLSPDLSSPGAFIAVDPATNSTDGHQVRLSIPGCPPGRLGCEFTVSSFRRGGSPELLVPLLPPQCWEGSTSHGTQRLLRANNVCSTHQGPPGTLISKDRVGAGDITAMTSTFLSVAVSSESVKTGVTAVTPKKSEVTTTVSASRNQKTGPGFARRVAGDN